MPMISKEYAGEKRTDGSVLVSRVFLIGFDAQVEQVVHLDKIIAAHGLGVMGCYPLHPASR